MNLTKTLIIDENLVDLALKLFIDIFPDEEILGFDGYDNWFTASIGKDDFHYWIHFNEEDKPVGLSGLYVENADKESAWLGWFGVLPKYRRMGYATEMIRHFEESARAEGFKHARLYTNTDNTAARAFYEKNGYKAEEFHGNVPDFIIGDIILYSKPLEGEFVPWNDRYLDF
jgi:ribosomal protein S18 acetylase RimI-like enzyme